MGDMEDALRAKGFRRAWVVDTEYCPFDNHPRPRCLCAVNLLSGERREVWLAGVQRPLCPFEMARDELFIFFAADADIGVFLSCDWTIPRHVLDPRVEFMRIRNGLAPLPPYDGGDADIAAEKDAKKDKKRRKKPGKFSLSRIARYFDIPFIDDGAKGEFRDLAMRIEDGFADVEQHALIGYCRGDVDATAEVLRRIWGEAGLSDPRTLDQALFRGFYMAVSAWVTYVGIPINMALYRRFSLRGPALRSVFIAAHVDQFDVYENGSFNFEKFAAFLDANGLLHKWPRTPKGQLAKSGVVLKRLAREHDIIEKLMSFLAIVDLLEGISTSFNQTGEIEWDRDKAKGLQICPDGRSRAALFPFGTLTSRNALAGGSLFIHPAWMRFLIKAPKGKFLLYCDWAAQELRIAAIRSGDLALLTLCGREDPYIELAIPLGLAPLGATKKTHPRERKIGKVLTLAML
jgi:hypothetical protein